MDSATTGATVVHVVFWTGVGVLVAGLVYCSR
jgi:hypothetical protein